MIGMIIYKARKYNVYSTIFSMNLKLYELFTNYNALNASNKEDKINNIAKQISGIIRIKCKTGDTLLI